MGIGWQNRVTDLEVVNIEAMIKMAQLRWTGHVIRMDNSRILRQLRYGVLAQGHRNLDGIKDTLELAGVAAADVVRSAQDRAGWRTATNRAFEKFEECRQEKITAVRHRRKASASAPPPTSFQCPRCPTVCASRIGLMSHSSTHQRLASSVPMVNQHVQRKEILGNVLWL